MPTPNNSQAWFDCLQHEWEKHKGVELPEPIDLAGFLASPPPPEWFQRDMEYQYRKGFYHGIVEAAELVLDLCRRGGYSRPAEIGNMLGNWCEELRKWKCRSVTETPLCSHGTPSLKWVPWSEIKFKVHERDGFRCVRCGSTERLEAHHIEPVSDGGVPVEDNLESLCWKCHHGGAA